MWLAPAAIATWEAVGGGTRGGQRQYADLAIETALTRQLIFHLPLRQTEGVLTSIFRMLGLDLSAPDHTTRSRRGQHLDLSLRRAPAGAGLHLMVDSTGPSVVGEGEWAAATHGGRGRRGWKTRHLGVDRSGVIVARALTEASVDDATTGITLIEAVDGALGRVTADAAPRRSAATRPPVGVARPSWFRRRVRALVRGCGQAYALQTVAPVTYRCGTRRVCQARSSGSERDTRARPHAVAPMNGGPEDSRRRSTCTGRTHSPRARAEGHQTPSSTVAVRAPAPS